MERYVHTVGKFVKDWMLVLAMIAGASAYMLWRSFPPIHTAGPILLTLCTKAQPLLLFAMLFLSFCRIEPSQMKPRRWMLWLLLIQGLSFSAIALLLSFCPGIPLRAGLEAAMLCFICPTATACAVVTGKLGGNMADVVTYTVLVNLMVAALVPLLIPFVHPVAGLSFGTAFLKILGKVFPLLIMPCLLAWLVRYAMPALHARLLRYTHVSFYIWALSLTLAILMSTRAIVSSGSSAALLLEIALASLLCCAAQFAFGKAVGARYGSAISAGQALGQKNTVFGIWMGYTFLDPVISVAGGFYSIWHNCYNTWQLRRRCGQSC